MEFTKEEMMLMMLYSPGDLPGLIVILQEMRRQLAADERELAALTDAVLSKLAAISEAEFDALPLYENL